MVESKKRKLEDTQSHIAGDNRTLKFRNYQPREQALSKLHKPEEPQSISDDNPIKKELRKYQKEELNILPRNNNWDVKKLLEPRLAKLKRRTQRAVVDFLREKLSNMSDSEDSENEVVHSSE